MKPDPIVIIPGETPEQAAQRKGRERMLRMWREMAGSVETVNREADPSADDGKERT